MKFTAFILAFLVMWFSCMPCEDSKPNDVYASMVLESGKGDASHLPNALADHCTPFCTCSCCTGTSFKIPVLALVEFKAPPHVHFPADLAFDEADISLPIWQPPQLTA